MNEVKRGDFFGRHYEKTDFGNLVITDTEYTYTKVDWHYHQNAYFTYLLQGKLFEKNKKEAYYLNPGSLLFHNWQDAHCNIKPPEYTRGFHIELKADWFEKYNIPLLDFEGSLYLKNPLVKSLMNQVFLETKINDRHSETSIELLMIDIFNNIKNQQSNLGAKRPSWVGKLYELILETEIDYSLSRLSQELNIHPVHLSRTFHKYFGITLGQYIRHIKLNKAILLISTRKFSMTEICYKCGFYDQSHFISNFKSIYKTTPSSFSKKISQC